jgi:hypothetical protein
MRIHLIVGSCVAAAFAAACADSTTIPTQPGSLSLPVQFAGAGSTERHEGEAHGFNAHLQGRNEVPAVNTNAQGQANFKLNDDGTVSFKLIVANIQNVTQAHIHCGTANLNGPVVVWLYPAPPQPAAPVLIPGRSQGTLSEGTFSGGNVIPRPDSIACPGGVANLDELLEKIRTGGAYVNVHTSQFPPGEIRGQLP